MTELVLQRPDPMADFGVGAGFLIERGTAPGVAARLQLAGPLELSPAAARNLAAWLAAYADDCEA